VLFGRGLAARLAPECLELILNPASMAAFVLEVLGEQGMELRVQIGPVHGAFVGGVRVVLVREHRHENAAIPDEVADDDLALRQHGLRVAVLRRALAARLHRRFEHADVLLVIREELLEPMLGGQVVESLDRHRVREDRVVLELEQRVEQLVQCLLASYEGGHGVGEARSMPRRGPWASARSGRTPVAARYGAAWLPPTKSLARAPRALPRLLADAAPLGFRADAEGKVEGSAFPD